MCDGVAAPTGHDAPTGRDVQELLGQQACPARGTENKTTGKTRPLLPEESASPGRARRVRGDRHTRQKGGGWWTRPQTMCFLLSKQAARRPSGHCSEVPSLSVRLQLFVLQTENPCRVQRPRLGPEDTPVNTGDPNCPGAPAGDGAGPPHCRWASRREAGRPGKARLPCPETTVVKQRVRKLPEGTPQTGGTGSRATRSLEPGPRGPAGRCGQGHRSAPPPEATPRPCN